MGRVGQRPDSLGDESTPKIPVRLQIKIITNLGNLMIRPFKIQGINLYFTKFGHVDLDPEDHLKTLKDMERVLFLGGKSISYNGLS